MYDLVVLACAAALEGEQGDQDHHGGREDVGRQRGGGRATGPGTRVALPRVREALDSADVRSSAPRSPTRAAVLGLALAAFTFLGLAGSGAPVEPNHSTAVDVALDLTSPVASRSPHGPRPTPPEWISHLAIDGPAPRLIGAPRSGHGSEAPDHATPLLRWRLAHSTSSAVD